MLDPGEFAFEGGPEGLDRSVVVAVAGGTERLVEFEVGDSLRERQRRIRSATVAVVHDTTVRAATLNAIDNASVTSSVLGELLIDQPTTRRDHKSMTAARCNQPSPVRNCVTSAAQSWSGPRREIAIDQVGCRRAIRAAVAPPAAGMHPDQAPRLASAERRAPRAAMLETTQTPHAREGRRRCASTARGPRR